MDAIGDFFWFAMIAVEVAVAHLWFLTIPAALGVVVAGTLAIADPAPMRGKWRWIAIQPAFPIGILAYGAICRFTGGVGGAPHWAQTPIFCLLAVQIVLILVLAVCVRKSALVPIGFGFFGVVVSLSAALPSAMAVTNVWL